MGRFGEIAAGYFASMFMSPPRLEIGRFEITDCGICNLQGASYFGMGDLRTFSLYGSLLAACSGTGVLFGSGMLLLVFGNSKR